MVIFPIAFGCFGTTACKADLTKQKHLLQSWLHQSEDSEAKEYVEETGECENKFLCERLAHASTKSIIECHLVWVAH